MSLITEYFTLTKKYQEEFGEKVVLLMQVGAFFEVYGMFDKTSETIRGSRITDFSQICELNIVEKTTCVDAGHTIMMAGFKDIVIEKYLKKLQEAGFTAVVYTQDTNTKNTNRSLAGIFSPGTYFQTESTSLTNSIACIWIDLIENVRLFQGKHVVIGVSNIDIFTGNTSIFQYQETYVNNPTTYDELERFMSIYNPSEVILIANLPTDQDLDNVLSYAGVHGALVHRIRIDDGQQPKIRNCEKQAYQREILSRFYKHKCYEEMMIQFNDNHIATQSCCYLLDFVYQHNPRLVDKIAEPVFENCSTRLSLANHSLKQLNIISDGSVQKSRLSSVSDLLNHCLTPMGRRAFLHQLLHPTFDEAVLTREYEITDHLLKSYDHYTSQFKQRLSMIKDMSKMERQICLKKASPKHIYALYTSIQLAKELFLLIRGDKELTTYLWTKIDQLNGVGKWCDDLLALMDAQLVLATMKDLDQLSQFDTNFFKPGVDAELDDSIRTLRDSEAKLEAVREYLSNQIESREKKASDYVRIHETDKNNYGLVSTIRRCKILHESLPLQDTTVTLISGNGDFFPFNVTRSRFSFEKQSSSNNYIIHDWVKSLCANITHIKVSMKDCLTRVYNQFIEELSKHQEALDYIIQLVTRIDVLYAKIYIAREYHYCKPEIIAADKSMVDAHGLRHCLMERFTSLNELYVTNNLVLGDGQTDGILLYGTNAVGKTTLIRALGIAVIMAQAGLYVPCDTFRFRPYKQIFTRIIGNDNIFKGLSTFEVEMSELRTILRLMDKDSLILGDELCSGTETVSAISIFVAGIQQLHACNTSFIFATHLHEIVRYDEIANMATVHLKHMEVIYDKERGVLVYDRKLKDGSGTSLYGLEVCKSLHLPSAFLSAANDIRLKYHPDGQSMLSLKTSRYNAQKLMGTCERCGKERGTEVHHLQHQADANAEGIIVTEDAVFHKNALANLMTLCETCHQSMHAKDQDVKSKRVRTSKGGVTKPTSKLNHE
ncbi:MAG: MutS-related protein [Flavobacterium sp.]